MTEPQKAQHAVASAGATAAPTAIDTERNDRIFHCWAAFLATVGLSAEGAIHPASGVGARNRPRSGSLMTGAK